MDAKKFRIFKVNNKNYQKVYIVRKDICKVSAVLLNFGNRTMVEVSDDIEGVCTMGAVQVPTTDLYSKSDKELVEMAYHLEKIVP